MSISINGDFSNLEGTKLYSKAMLLINLLTSIVSILFFLTIVIFKICKKMKKKISLTQILKKFEKKDKE
jgi:hypothetical protein